MMQEQKHICIKSLYFAMRFNTKMWCDNIINKLLYTIERWNFYFPGPVIEIYIHDML